MKRARDIRDQLEGLVERVETEISSSNMNELDSVRKSIVAGTRSLSLSLTLVFVDFEMYLSLSLLMNDLLDQVFSRTLRGCRRMDHIEL